MSRQNNNINNNVKSENNDLKKENQELRNELDILKAQSEKSENVDLEKENQELKNELDVLKAQMNLIMKNINNNSNSTSNPTDEDILVISMCNWKLNLSTEPMGAGTIYAFDSFGEEQMIPKDDLKRIVKVNSKFAKEGLFYIADEDFIKSEKLSSVYSKLLDVDGMISLLNSNKNNFEKIFKSLSEIQKDTFIDLVSKKLLNNEEVDMNIVSICSKISGRNIVEEVEQAKVVLGDKE